MTQHENPGMAFRLTSAQLDRFFSGLSQTFRLYASRFRQRGRFSDTDCIRYADIRTPDEIEWREKSDFSPKEIVFPVNQSLFQFVNGAWIEPAIDERPVWCFCEPATSMALTGSIPFFLKTASATRITSASAPKSILCCSNANGFDTCFCVSMGTNTTDNYEMTLRLYDDGTAGALIRSEDVRQRIPADAATTAFAPIFPTQDGSPVELPPIDKLTGAASVKTTFSIIRWRKVFSTLYRLRTLQF